MKTIVALVDFSDLTFKVLKQAHQQAKAFSSEVVILHMVPRQPVIVGGGVVAATIMQDPTQEEVNEHHALLLETRDSMEQFGVQATIRQLNGANLEDVLAEAKKLSADMIILGSHHHGAIYNMLIGSVTNEVLKRAHCPVLVVPANDVAQEKK